jgi:uncharacterized membrane protein
MILWIGNIIPVIGTIAFFLGSIWLFSLMIQGVIHALNGEYWEMPVLAKYAKQINL